jgi:glycine/D-amino acid oxidase-like deaminating enzyme
MRAGGVTHWQNCPSTRVRTAWPAMARCWTAHKGAIRCRSVVVATGGLSIPKIGATDFGYRIARQFGLPSSRPGRRWCRWCSTRPMGAVRRAVRPVAAGGDRDRHQA